MVIAKRITAPTGDAGLDGRGTERMDRVGDDFTRVAVRFGSAPRAVRDEELRRAMPREIDARAIRSILPAFESHGVRTPTTELIVVARQIERLPFRRAVRQSYHEFDHSRKLRGNVGEDKSNQQIQNEEFTTETRRT